MGKKMVRAFVVGLFLTAGSAVPAAASQRVFVTAPNYNGNLGGLAGGDSICQHLAAQQGLGGSWVAWLSDASTAAKDRLKGDGPFVRLDGTVIANNRTTLLFTGFPTPTLQDAIDASATNLVWTGTSPDGTARPNTCSDWMVGTNASEGEVGKANEITRYWTWFELYTCGSSFALYCFEQPGNPAPTLATGSLLTVGLLLLLIGCRMAVRRAARLGTLCASQR